jgi:hypothetical protein
MDIEKSMLRNFEQCLGKNSSVRDDDGDVGFVTLDLVEELARADLRGLLKFQAELPCSYGDGGSVQLHSAAGWTVGLGNDESDIMLARECIERRNCEVGSAEEDDAHGRGILVEWSAGILRALHLAVRYVVVAVVVVAVVVVVAGGVSVSVVDGGGGGVDVPSTPLFGCGEGWPIPCAAGVSDFVAGGCVASGGAFW